MVRRAKGPQTPAARGGVPVRTRHPRAGNRMLRSGASRTRPGYGLTGAAPLGVSWDPGVPADALPHDPPPSPRRWECRALAPHHVTVLEDRVVTEVVNSQRGHWGGPWPTGTGVLVRRAQDTEGRRQKAAKGWPQEGPTLPTPASWTWKESRRPRASPLGMACSVECARHRRTKPVPSPDTSGSRRRTGA